MQPIRRLPRARHDQLDPVRTRRHDLDRRHGRALERIAHDRDERRGFDGLVQVLIRMPPYRLQHRLRRIVGRHDDDARPGFETFHAVEHGEAVHARHPHVEEYEIEFLPAHARERCGAVLSHTHGVAGFRQRRPRQMSGRPIVVHHEDVGSTGSGRHDVASSTFSF
jgi:hypothetical protein